MLKPYHTVLMHAWASALCLTVACKRGVFGAQRVRLTAATAQAHPAGWAAAHSGHVITEAPVQAVAFLLALQPVESRRAG